MVKLYCLIIHNFLACELWMAQMTHSHRTNMLPADLQLLQFVEFSSWPQCPSPSTPPHAGHSWSFCVVKSQNQFLALPLLLTTSLPTPHRRQLCCQVAKPVSCQCTPTSLYLMPITRYSHLSSRNLPFLISYCWNSSDMIWATDIEPSVD